MTFKKIPSTFRDIATPDRDDDRDRQDQRLPAADPLALFHQLKPRQETVGQAADADVMAMGARLSAYTSHFPSGPLAVVGHDESVVLAFKRFVNISPSKRPAALFKTEKKARAWLATQAGA